MSIIRLRFKDINNQVIGDLEVSQEIPIEEMLPLILKQLGLDNQDDWKFILEQNRSVDPRYSFNEVGARDGSVVRVMAADVPPMPLIQELQLTIATSQLQIGDTQRGRRVRISEQDVSIISRLLEQRRHILVAGAPGAGKSRLIQHIRDRLITPLLSIHLDDFKSVKTVLRDMARVLHQRHQLAYLRDEDDSEAVHRKLSRWQLDDLTTLVCDSLRGHGYVLTIDSLDTITPAGITALQELTQAATVLAAVSTDCLDRLAFLSEQFERIELRRGGYLDPIWIVGIFGVLLIVFHFVSQANGMTVAYLFAGGLSALLLILRAILWKGPNMKLRKLDTR